MRQRRRFQLRVQDDDADDQEGDDADLHEGAEIRSRRQQHPDGQDRRGDGIERHRDRDLVFRQQEPVAERRFGDVLSEHHGQKHHDDPDDRGFANVSLPPPEHVEAHQHGERDRHEDGERPPCALRQRIDHDDAQASHGDHDDEQDRDGGGEARDRADIAARDVRQRTAAATRGGPQPERILNSAGEADARKQPDQRRDETELGRQNRTDQRPCPGNRGKVMPEKNPPGGRVVVGAVVLGVSRSDSCVVKGPDFRRDEGAVVAISNP